MSFWYQLAIESNIPLFLCGNTELPLCVLCFIPTNPKIFNLSNSTDELMPSSLKNLLKYSHAPFLISSSFVRSHFISSLKHLTWIMSLIFLSLPSHWYISSYNWPLALLTACFAIFFTTLYYSTLWTLLYRCKWLNTLSSHQYHFTHSHFTIMFI
jgi:hypothetical protein